MEEILASDQTVGRLATRRRRRRRSGSCCQSFNKNLTQGVRKRRTRRMSTRCWTQVVHCCSFAILLWGVLLTTIANNGCLAGRIEDLGGGGEVQISDAATDMAPLADKRPQTFEEEANEKLGVPIGWQSQKSDNLAHLEAPGATSRGHQLAARWRRAASGYQRQLIGSSFSSSPPEQPLRAVGGSKSEPPSRPQVDWSKQRPYFGPDMMRNVSVELGKTAYLSCKVFELGDKTVLWLRPSQNEILTAGRFTYIGDPRFAAINNNGSHDWILEIKDVGLNDSTSYECQVSTDPKMSVIINLQVKAAKAKIRQGEQYYAPIGSNIEFVCEIGQRASPSSSSSSLLHSQQTLSTPVGVQQTYWYHNGNLLNYAQRTHLAIDKNFSIEWDTITQNSRFKLFNVQLNDAGNYTCKPTSAEPATIRLTVKKINKGATNRSQHGNGHHSPGSKEAQRNRQHYGLDSSGNSLELNESSGTSCSPIYLDFLKSTPLNLATLISCLSLAHVVFNNYQRH